MTIFMKLIDMKAFGCSTVVLCVCSLYLCRCNNLREHIHSCPQKPNIKVKSMKSIFDHCPDCLRRI